MTESNTSSEAALPEPWYFEERSCDQHGAYNVKVDVSRGYAIRASTTCPTCEKERDDEDEKRQIEWARKNREDSIRRRLARSGIPERFRSSKLESFVADTQAQQRVAKVVARFVEQFQPGSGVSLLLLGKCGTGKTLLGCAAVTALIEAGANALYTRCTDALRSIKATYSRKSEISEAQATDRLISPDLLVLDEVGVQFNTDHESVLLFEIIDRRYEERKSTILISNFSAAELQPYLGERIMDRFRETGAVIAFDWASHRGKAPA